MRGYFWGALFVAAWLLAAALMLKCPHQQTADGRPGHCLATVPGCEEGGP